MPPVLDLRCSLGRANIRLQAVMYAPNDPEARQEFEASAYAKAVIEKASSLNCESDADWQSKRIDPRQVIKQLADAAQAPALSDALRKLADAGTRGNGISIGANTGRVLGGVLQSRGTVERVIAAMSHIAGKSGYRFMSEDSIRRDWLASRHVSHIWLGHLMAVGMPHGLRLLSREELLEVLGRADDYRRRGEAYTTGTRALPLLDPATTWRFKHPDGAVLPEPA